MIEIQRVKNSVKEDLERRYLEAVEQSKRKDHECEELKIQLRDKIHTIKELERRYEKAKNEQEKLEEQLLSIKKDLN